MSTTVSTAQGVTTGLRFNQVHPGNAAAVTPSDTVDLSIQASELYVGGAGDVVVLHAGDLDAVTFKAVPVGTTLHGQFRRVLATGTTATNLLARW